ncbi:EAL domain-containing protein [Citromicrobium bathyomarinum]|uniref:sensor domain-containing phosphodiesterase n=1 Tax=Citromicrobium bathyomarinum TaxID=72174 RepID=UPI00315AA6F0
MDFVNIDRHLRDEDKRLAELANLAILDTGVEAEFEELTALAASALGMESAAISLVDHDRQWFKSRVNLPMSQTPRDIAFCHHTVERREVMVVKDASLDPRFKDNPLVVAKNGIRFYAGAPLILDSGFCVGSLCVIDSQPREEFEEKSVAVLEGLARIAARLMAARRDRLKGEIAAKVVQETTDAIIAADRAGRIVLLNRAAEELFGHAAEDALGESIEMLMPQRFRHGHQRKVDNAANGGPTRLLNTFVELPIKTADGREIETEVSLAPWGEAGASGGFAAIFRDITDRKALEADRQEARSFLDAIIANLPTMLFVKDARTGRYLMVNRQTAKVAGIPQEAFVGKTDTELLGADGAKFERQDRLTMATKQPQAFEVDFVRSDGREFHLRTTRVMMDGPDASHQYILGMVEDMTDIRQSEAENVRLAHFDGLTGLRNRKSISTLLGDYVAEGVPFAMLNINLDRFKSVNEQFGHHAGDAVLVEAGLRLKELTKQRCALARTGADEFVILLKGERLNQRAMNLADRIVEVLAEPIETHGQLAHIGASVGVVLYPDDGTTIEKLREHGDLALDRAKKSGRGMACMFDAGTDAAVRDRQTLECDLRAAICAGEITLAYQPVFGTRSGEFTSVEGLARGEHPTRGFINPEVFISLAEDCGLIDELGCQLLDMACDDAKQWPEQLRVAVNLSPMQFRSGELVSTVRSALKRSGLTPDRLQLEVTERLMIEDTDETFSQLKELRELGIQILIDDFGVGHSSLSYFKVLPFDKVKIDKSFIADIETSKPDRAIVEAVVGLGRELSMGIVAEGVETEAQRALLTKLGCTHLQGYYFSPALPREEVGEFITQGGAWQKRQTAAIA